MAISVSSRWLALVVLSMCLSGCVVTPPQPDRLPASGAELVDVDWVVAQITGVPSVVEPVPRLRWSSAEQIAGSGGCNVFAGRAVVRQGVVQIGRLAATGRMCLALPQGGQEDRFFKALESARTVRLVNGQLHLEDEAGQLLARFTNAKPAP